MLKDHVLLKSYNSWKTNQEIDPELKAKANNATAPVIDKIIQETTYTEEQKEKIKNVAKDQDEIYNTCLDKFKE